MNNYFVLFCGIYLFSYTIIRFHIFYRFFDIFIDSLADHTLGDIDSEESMDKAWTKITDYTKKSFFGHRFYMTLTYIFFICVTVELIIACLKKVK